MYVCVRVRVILRVFVSVCVRVYVCEKVCENMCVRDCVSVFVWRRCDWVRLCIALQHFAIRTARHCKTLQHCQRTATHTD